MLVEILVWTFFLYKFLIQWCICYVMELPYRLQVTFLYLLWTTPRTKGIMQQEHVCGFQRDNFSRWNLPSSRLVFPQFCVGSVAWTMIGAHVLLNRIRTSSLLFSFLLMSFLVWYMGAVYRKACRRQAIDVKHFLCVRRGGFKEAHSRWRKAHRGSIRRT